ncbi:hypothetical protein HSX11_29800 [Oxalobacteraceae bacterium]|nr:hypothetical protein [Oxalobacteraceae bacterium]
MHWIGLLLAASASVCLYGASPHQRLWPRLAKGGVVLRWGALALLLGALALAGQGFGAWRGGFIVLTVAMLALVALPGLDALARGRHVA